MATLDAIFIWVLAGPMLALSLAMIAPGVVSHVSRGVSGITFWEAFYFAFLGSLAGLPVLLSGKTVDPEILLGFTLLGIFLIFLAGLDRETSWAPDVFVLPFCCFAVWVGTHHVEGSAGWFEVLLLGLALFVVAQGVFFGLLYMKIVLPPPDIIGLATPLVVFGVSKMAVACFVLVSIILLILRVSGEMRMIIFKKDVAEDLQEENRLSITFLVVVFPVVFVVLPWSPLI